MKSRLASLITMVILASALPAVLLAQDGAWKMPNLNPFSQKGKPPTSARSTASANSTWRWPSLWSSSPTKKAKANTKQPSAVQNVTKSTKQFFSKTADALNPFDDAQAKQKQLPITGSNTVFSQASSSKAKDAKNTSLIPSWMSGGSTKEEKPKTVTDFLAQPRPQP